MPKTGMRVRFRGKSECDRMVGFRFEKPEDYHFKAGQYLRLTLDTREGKQTKSFSHASAPSDAFLSIGTRLSGSAFKDALAALKPGDYVSINGPYGALVLSPDTPQVVFLAGGVGITPCRSMIRDIEQHRRRTRMMLFYGNHDQMCIPYLAEFERYGMSRDNFDVVHVLEDPLPGWNGERGLVTADVVRRHLEHPEEWLFVVAGPPAMVDAMLAVTADLEVPKTHVLVERFIPSPAPTAA